MIEPRRSLLVFVLIALVWPVSCPISTGKPEMQKRIKRDGSPHGNETTRSTATANSKNNSTPRKPHSRSKQSVELDNEGTIFESWKARGQRVPFVGIDDEQLAAWLIFPSKPNVSPQGIATGIELH